MTDAANVPCDPPQAALIRELAAVKDALADFREALRPVNNDELNDAFRQLLDQAEAILATHPDRPGEYIADDVANLRSLFARPNIPREDPPRKNSSRALFVMDNLGERSTFAEVLEQTCRV